MKNTPIIPVNGYPPIKRRIKTEIKTITAVEPLAGKISPVIKNIGNNKGKKELMKLIRFFFFFDKYLAQ